MKPCLLFPTLVAVLTFSAQDASACSCLKYYANAMEALGDATFVFTGEVIEIERVAIPTTVFMKESGDLVPRTVVGRFGLSTLKVLQEWKGGGTTQYKILTGAPSDEPLPRGMVVVGGCQVHLEVGKKYLIFAHGRFPEADYCMPNAELEEATQSINELDDHVRRDKVNQK